MVFGLGGPSLKGCTADVALVKTEYQPGDVVEGQLTLTIETEVECLEFTLEMVGQETLTWQITTSSRIDDTTTDNYDVKNDIFRKETSLLQPDQTVLLPGQNVYPISFSLPTNLPGTQETIPIDANGWEKIKSQISYCIEVKIHQKGAKEPKRVTKTLVIPTLPLSRAMYPGRPLDRSSDIRVLNFCCFNKGVCTVALSVERDAIDINTGVVPLVATITNETNATVKSLAVALQQDLLVHIPSGEHKTSFPATLPLIHAKEIDETIAPHTTKEGIQLPVSMAEYLSGFHNSVGKNKTTRTALVPSCDAMFASIRFRVVVILEFKGGFLTTDEADLPIVLLNLCEPTALSAGDDSLVAPVAPTTTIPATVASDVAPEAATTATVAPVTEDPTAEARDTMTPADAPTPDSSTSVAPATDSPTVVAPIPDPVEEAEKLPEDEVSASHSSFAVPVSSVE